jgi:hypothetical protein
MSTLEAKNAAQRPCAPAGAALSKEEDRTFAALIHETRCSPDQALAFIEAARQGVTMDLIGATATPEEEAYEEAWIDSVVSDGSGSEADRNGPPRA